MKNTLAENLLRFGVKNFTNEDLYQISQLLKEQAIQMPSVPAINLDAWRAIPQFAKDEGIFKQFMARNEVLTTLADAAALAVLATYNINVSYTKLLSKPDAMMKAMTKAGVDFSRLATEPSINYEMVQFNESPDAKGSVLTKGIITANSFTPNNEPDGASALNDIVTYMNNYNILCAVNGIKSQVRALPYKRNTGVGKSAAIDGNFTFIDGIPGKDPGAGSFDLELATGAYDPLMLYGLKDYKAASGQTKGDIKSEVTYTPGPELVSNLGKQLFKTGTITPEPVLAQRIKEAVNAAKSLGTITAVRIESGASFDRPVNANNDQFAKMVGMPADKVPADPTKDIEGIVKDPMSGGNAFLAYYRGIALKNALGNEAGVAPTVIAKVQKGGTGATPEETEALRDNAQYAKIIFSIKKPDDSTTITKDDVNSIGAGSTTTALGGLFKVIRFDVV
jgi:hypothetical protein